MLMKVISKIRDFYQALYIRQKILLAFAIMIIVLLSLLGLVSYHYSSKVVRELTESYTNNVVKQSVLNVDSFFDECNKRLQTISNNEIMIESIMDFDLDYQHQLVSLESFKKILLQYNFYHDSIDDIIVIKEGKGIYNTGHDKVRADYDYYQQEWFVNHLPDKVRAGFIPPHINNYYYNNPKNRYVISAVIPVMDSMHADNTKQGYILMDLKMDRITTIFNDLAMNDYAQFFMTGDENQIVYHADESNITDIMEVDEITGAGGSSGNYTGIYQGSPTQFIYQTSSVTGWKVIGAISLDSLDQNVVRIRQVTMGIIVLGILFTIAVAYFITARNTKTISSLVMQMEAVSEGNYQGQVEVGGSGEMAVLGSRFNEMVNNINILIKENLMVTIRQKEAEYNALQSKINPHFLNNTLQMIHSMAVLGRTKEIQSLIENLSELFDYVLYEHNNNVPLQDEIRYIQNYLSIYKNKYVRRFDYEVNVCEDVLEVYIPKLLLQPLVENALLHGLKEKAEGGLISVQINRNGIMIEVQVKDNGCGIKEQRLNELRRLLDSDQPADNSIGIKNIYDRLKLTYGADAEFVIDSTVGQGTCVTVRFLARRIGNESAEAVTDPCGIQQTEGGIGDETVNRR